MNAFIQKVMWLTGLTGTGAAGEAKPAQPEKQAADLQEISNMALSHMDPWLWRVIHCLLAAINSALFLKSLINRLKTSLMRLRPPLTFVRYELNLWSLHCWTEPGAPTPCITRNWLLLISWSWRIIITSGILSPSIQTWTEWGALRCCCAVRM